MPTVISASVSTPRLYEEIPDIDKQAVMSALYTGRSISNSLLMASMTGPMIKLNKLNRYSKSENYFYGPTEVTADLETTDSALAWLEHLNKTPFLIDGHRTFYKIVATDVADIGTNGIASYQEAYALQNTPITEPDIYSRTEITTGNIAIYKLTGGAGGPEVLHLNVSRPVLGSRQHYVTYQIWKLNLENGDTEPTVHLELVDIYNESTNLIPKLHEVTAVAPDLNEEVFPLIPIRMNGVNYGTEPGSLEGSASIKQILKRIQIDPADIIGAIEGTAEEPNPDADLIDDVYLMSGISIAGEEPWEIAALAETFAMLWERNPDSFDVYTDTNTRQKITIRVQDPYGIRYELLYNFITVNTFEGEVGYTKSFAEGEVVEVCVESGVPGEVPVCKFTESTNVYTFTRPLNIPGVNLYDEIKVSGLVVTHEVIANEVNDYREVRFEGTEEELIIPLFKTAALNTPKSMHHEVALGSMRLTVYAIEIIHLSWYETAFFKKILLLVTIVFAIFTYGASLQVGFAAGAAAGFYVIAQIIVTQLIIDYGVQWLVENVGGDLALLLILAFAFYTKGKGLDLGSFSTALNTSWYNLISLTTKVHGYYIEGEVGALQEQIESAQEELKKRQAEIKTAKELIGFSDPLALEDIVEYRTIPNINTSESPSDFYTRTSTTIDLAAINSSLVSDYHSIQTLLPTVESSFPQSI